MRKFGSIKILEAHEVEELSGDDLVVTKDKGNISVLQIEMALAQCNFEGQNYVLFVKPYQFDGYSTEDFIRSVTLHNLNAENCPVCSKSLEKFRDEIYEEAYQHGFNDGKSDI